MNDVALQKQIDELAEEVSLAGDYTQAGLEELRARVDRIKLEIVALRMALDAALPSFSTEYERSFEKARLEVNPESD
ncbi:MAG: hypothetical protein K9M82_04510 [Deltaproteobacteria bacterium]|nr:hypothetical protein [Deltaproteobacteria bacterium]